MFSRFSYIFGVFRLFPVFLTFSLLCHSSYTFTPDSLSPLISADASFLHLSACSSNQAAPDRHTLSSSIGTGKQRQIPVTGQHLVYCIGI